MDIQPRPDVTELTVAAQLTGELRLAIDVTLYLGAADGCRSRRPHDHRSDERRCLHRAIDLTGQDGTSAAGLSYRCNRVTLVDPTDVTVTVEIEPIQGQPRVRQHSCAAARA